MRACEKHVSGPKSNQAWFLVGFTSLGQLDQSTTERGQEGVLSAAGRVKIDAAARKRWAKIGAQGRKITR